MTKYCFELNYLIRQNVAITNYKQLFQCNNSLSMGQNLCGWAPSMKGPDERALICNNDWLVVYDPNCLWLLNCRTKISGMYSLYFFFCS